MKLTEVLHGAETLFVSGNTDLEITDLSEDSRTAKAGTLFFARQGAKVSGLKFVKEALGKGAAAVVSDEKMEGLGVPFVQVASVSKAESAMSEIFFDRPSRKLKVVGVTGTNGKTTFTYLLESIALHAGKRAGVIGTINYRIPQKGSEAIDERPAPNTTPNIIELERLLHAMSGKHCDWALMEVSSHALVQGRVEPIHFAGAVFTNLTQDHLDFHKTMEDYFAAKARLFKIVSPEGFCVVNVDDPYGNKMAALSNAPVTTYGLVAPADCSAKDIRLEAGGSRFTLWIRKENAPVKLRISGKHNIYNCLAAAAAAHHLGIALKDIITGLENLAAVPGRLEAVHCGQDFTVLVDYAHTEDALKNVLESLKPLAKGRILTLFGCGGDRDRSKRPLMGAAAARLSDFVVITSDNPRSEEPDKITLDIEVGIHRAELKNYEVIIDREEAIRRILQMAKKDDIVLLAGKGHENYQIFKDKTVNFDDREIARNILTKKR